MSTDWFHVAFVFWIPLIAVIASWRVRRARVTFAPLVLFSAFGAALLLQSIATLLFGCELFTDGAISQSCGWAGRALRWAPMHFLVPVLVAMWLCRTWRRDVSLPVSGDGEVPRP